MASECTEGLWQAAAQFQPSPYPAEDITDRDMQVTLLDGTFMVPPLDGQLNYPSRRLKIQIYAVARQARDHTFMNTDVLTSETLAEDVEEQFNLLIEQATGAFAALTREAPRPLWSRATGFIDNFQDLGTFPIAQLNQIKTKFLVLSKTITNFYQLLDSVIVGNFETITLSPAKTKTARGVQDRSTVSTALLDLYLPELLPIDAVTAFTRLLVELFISYEKEGTKLTNLITEINNLQMPDDYQLEASLNFGGGSFSLATQAKAKEMMRTLNDLRARMGSSIRHMKNVTGQSVTEIHRSATLQQARSFSMALSFNQVLQSKDWEFRRHLCHYYDKEWADHVANTIINFAEASRYGPNS